MASVDAIRDQNHVPVALAVQSTDSTATYPFTINPITGRLLVDMAGGGSGTVTSIAAGTGILATPDPITTTGTIALALSLQPLATLGTGGQLIRVNAGATALEYFTAAAGGVDSVVGTANRIVVDSTDPANPVVNISTSYAGQATITTLGTIATGVWNGTAIVGQYGGTGVANTGKTITVSGNTVIGTGTDTVSFATTGNTSVTLPTSGTLATTTYVPTAITVANEATDTSCFIAFFTAATGDLGPKTNANMTFNSNTGVVTFASSVLTTTDINGGTVDGTVIGGASAAAGTFTLATAEGFAPTSSTATGNRMYLPAANTIGFAINGSGELQLTATALSPISDDGLALGTTALGWQSLFGDTGFVINIENGDWVATHTAGILTVGTGDLRVTTAGTNTASVVTVGGTQTLTAKTLTSPAINTATLGGTSIFAEGGAIAYDAASSADGAYTGFVRAGTAGTTLAFGDLVYLAAADSRWELADADAATTSDRFLGMCVLAAAADGDPTTILLTGFIRADAAFPAMTIGSALYVGETAGDIQVAIPTGADNVIRRVGYAWTADELYFNPSMDSQITVA